MIRIWDIRKAMPRLKAFAHSQTAVQSINRPKVLSSHPYKKQTTLQIPKSPTVNGLKFTTDGISLVSTATDGTLNVWYPHSGVQDDVITPLIKVSSGPIRTKSQETVHFDLLPSRTDMPPLVLLPDDINVLMLDLKRGKYFNRLEGHLVKIK